MSTLKTPFKYDFVGSFLRPQRLKDAKEKYKNNEIGILTLCGALRA